MIYKALASALMAKVFASAKKQVVDIAKKEIIKAQKEGIRKDILNQVATQYAREAEYNFSQYVKSIEAAEVEVGFEGKPGQAFINNAEMALRELETYIEKQSQDGAVVKFLKQRYGEEGINIITGKLYAGHYVNRKSQGVYEIGNATSYAPYVDKRKPWLSGEKTTQGIEEMLANAAAEIFELTFEELDLSSDIALLKFSPTRGRGFKQDTPSSSSRPSKKRGKKKK